MTTSTDNTMPRRGNPLRWAVRGAALLLLLLPMVAMQFTPDVNWTGLDFAVFGGMLLVACSTYELAVWASDNTFYRAAFGLAVAGGFLLFWINLAVGILADHGPANLMYAGVLAVGVLGALIARMRPAGMVVALAAMAVAQALVAVLAMLFGLGLTLVATMATGFFVALWLASAWLFRQAAHQIHSAEAAP